MSANRRWPLSTICLSFLSAWPSSVRAETKHPAEETGIRSVSGDQATTIRFVNKSGKTLKVYWLDYAGSRKLYQTLKAGESYSVRTYLTHPWVITDENDNAWDLFLPTIQPLSVEVAAPAPQVAPPPPPPPQVAPPPQVTSADRRTPPAGAAARMGPGQTSHTAPVYWVAWSARGETLASTGEDGVRIWNPRTGAAVAAFAPAGFNTMVSGPSSFDGRIVAAGSSRGTVRIVSSATGAELRTVKPGKGRVIGLAFSPDARLLASSCYTPKEVSLTDSETGNALGQFTGHTGGVVSVAFSPDGRILASAGDDATVRLWDPAGREPGRVLAGHAKGVYRIAFSPDGRLLASAGRDTTIRIWEIATGQTVLTIHKQPATVASVNFSPDGRLLASCGDDKTIRIWEVRDGRELLKLQGHERRVNYVAFSPDGRSLASCGDDKNVVVWDVSGVRPTPATGKLTVDETERLWNDLAGEGPDAAEAAFRAAGRLSGAPDDAVALLARRLQPVPQVPDSTIRRLPAQMDAKSSPEREAASAELERLGGQALPAVRRILPVDVSVEVRSRLEDTHRKSDGWHAPTGETLRTLRAIAVLERIASPAAANLLENLAGGAPSEQTRLAKEALDRPAAPSWRNSSTKCGGKGGN